MTFFYSRKIFLGVFILVSVPLFGQNNTRIDIGKDSIDLGEVVVVGYGSQTRKQLTKKHILYWKWRYRKISTNCYDYSRHSK